MAACLSVLIQFDLPDIDKQLLSRSTKKQQKEGKKDA